MSGQVIIVIDAGTGGGRAAAVDETGRVRARAYRAWSYFEPPGLELYAKEFHPREFMALLAECCQEVAAKLKPGQIAGVTTTGMRQACVFLDADGEYIYGGPNRDVRGIMFEDEVAGALGGGEKVYKVTGRWPPWMFAPSRLFWFREEQPEVFEKIARVLMVNDWLIYWLCGEAAAEPTNAAETLFYDIRSGAWSKELLSGFGISESMLPKLLPCGAVAGELSAGAAAETGLPAGAPVITGMADTQAALLAAGVCEPGAAGVVTGSTAPVMMVTDEPRFDPKRRLWTGCHAVPGRWLIESNAGDAGVIHRGYLEGHLGLIAENKENIYGVIEELAAELEPGAMGVRAFLGPIIWDLAAMSPSVRAGVFFPYPVGETNAGPANVARAILENIAFAVRANLEQVIEVAGEPTRMAMAGGMTRSRLFRRIMAGVLGRELEVVEEPEATAIGCAAAGFTAIGKFTDLASAAAKVLEGSPEFIDRVPADPGEKEEYNDLFEEWREEYWRLMGEDED